MDASALFFELSGSDDWSGYTLHDVRSAVEFGVTNNLPPNTSDDERLLFLRRREDKIDYLFYLFGLAITLEDDDPTASISEMNRRWEARSLSYDSKKRLSSVYKRAFFYKYIYAVELQDLRTIVAVNSEGIINRTQAIEFYISRLLFPQVIEDNPGEFISYRNVEGVSQRRAEALDELRNAIDVALEANNTRALFAHIFSLMTDYPWSVYRSIHNASGYLFSFSKAEFKEAFLGELNSIIDSKGAVQI